MTDHNKKLPSPPSAGKKLKYPYYTVTQDVNGGKSVDSRVPGDANLVYSEKYSPTGSYESFEYDEERGEIKTSLNVGDTRSYTSGGSSVNVDGSMDQTVNSSMRTNVVGDVSNESGRNRTEIVKGQTIQGRGGPIITRGKPGSNNVSYNSSGGHVVNEHTGNHHESFKGDKVVAVTKNHVMMVNEGDHAVHVQSGNYDTKVKGKTRLYSEDELIIESGTKITLKVGGSTVIITSSGIDIDGNRIDLN